MRSIIPLSCALALTGILNAQDLTWPDPVANHVIPMQSSAITHGPRLGNVTSNSVRVWVRTAQEVEFEVLARPHRPPFDEAAVTTANTLTASDFTGFAEVTGLQPNTAYAYAVRVAGEIIDSRNNIRDPWPTLSHTAR